MLRFHSLPFKGQAPFFCLQLPVLLAMVVWLAGCGGAGSASVATAPPVVLSSAKDITAFSFTKVANPSLASDATAALSGSAIGVTLPYGQSRAALVATFLSTGASVSAGGQLQTSASSAQDFSNPVSYTVQAQDGSTKAYTVTVANSAALTLTLPPQGLDASTLAVVVADGDALSESIASYYQTKRGVPAANIVRVKVATSADVISESNFAALKAELDAKLPPGVQGVLLTWPAPSRVTGSCTMGITSAIALGFDAKYCANTCATTSASSYFDSESSRPYLDHAMRPAMMLGSRTLESAKALIDRGWSADASYPAGDGYLVRTSDTARSVRYTDFSTLPAHWSTAPALQLSYIDNANGSASDTVTAKTNVLFYFTGLVNVSGIASNTYRPGAVADHLTSYGGFLPSGNGQMPATAWLDAGVTASYGAVAEPCNFTQKFPVASVLIDHYYRGDTVMEAYWKSVQWPGQGLFLGEPLAQPFRGTSTLTVSGEQYVISSRALRQGSRYTLEYRTSATGTWTTLATFTPDRAQPRTLTAPLPPANAIGLRWVGPCAADKTQRCTLSTSI